MTSVTAPNIPAPPASSTGQTASAPEAPGPTFAAVAASPGTAPALAYHASAYRWVVLLAVVPILAITQMYWLTFSAIAPQAAAFYHTSALAIAVLSMSYMVAYIVLAVPAAMLADRRGIRACFLVGAALTAVFGVLRGVFSGDFALVVVAQLGMACAQPFVMNPITKMAAQWFPVNERATVSGVASVAGYLGIVIAMAVTPAMYEAMGMTPMLDVMGAVAVAAAALVAFGVRERPAAPAGPHVETSAFSWRTALGLRSNRNYVLLLTVVMIALGVFNALLTCLSDILTPRGISSDASGLIGSAIIVAGVVGAVALPMLSDRTHRRRVFILIAIVTSTVALAGLAWSSSYPLLMACGAVAGFFLMGAGPLIFQYGTEEGYPAPEATSYGLMMGSGQLSGIVFILMLYGLAAPDGSMTVPLTVLMAFMAVAVGLAFLVRESRLMRS